MANQLTERQMTFSSLINTKNYQEAIMNTLSDTSKAKSFCASLVAMVTSNEGLQECNPKSILTSALYGEALKLSPQLGQYYIVPFEDKKTKVKNGQFILGYKGIIQLALRTGQYKKINVLSLKKGELKHWNPITEDIEAELITDYEQRENTPTQGYVALFKLRDGYEKTIYWSYEQVLNHADRYAPAFSKDAVTTPKFSKVSYEDYLAKKYPKSDEWKYSSFWYKDFDAMAYKTLLRQLITKWGVMSAELQEAFEKEKYVAQDEVAPEVPEPEPPETLQESEPKQLDNAINVEYTESEIPKINLEDIQ